MPENIRVMLVDDRADQRKILCNGLRCVDGFDIIAQPESVAEAQELTARLMPHIVIFSENLSGLSLDEFPALIKRQHGESECLMLSADCERNAVFRALKAGACGCVCENGGIEELVKAIRCVHKGEIWSERMTISQFIKEIAGPSISEQATGNRKAVDIGLSFREREVLGCLANGLSNREIAEKLFISEMTVKTHVYNIFRKLNVGQRLKAAVLAVQQGLV